MLLAASVFGEGLRQPASFSASARSLNDTTIAFVQGRLGVDNSTVGYKSGYTAAAEKFVYVRQTHVRTLTICLTFIVSLTFLLEYRKDSLLSTLSPTLPGTKAEQAFNGKYNGFPTAVRYLARLDGSAALVHIQIQYEEVNSWYEAYVEAHSGEFLSATDFTVEASSLIRRGLRTNW